MSRFNEIFKLAATIGILVAVLAVFPYIQHVAVKECEATNASRRQSKIRGDILRQFIQDAATARSDSGNIELNRGEISKARIDFAAAAKYNLLAGQIVDLPERNC